MYNIIFNDKKINNPKYSLGCVGFERNEIQKLKNRYPGAKVLNTMTGVITPIEKF